MTAPDILQVALSYAARGWHVFPCKPGSKEPLTEHGFHDATTDPQQITAWWQETPNANVAAACQPSDLAPIDVDDMESWRELCQRYGISEETVQQVTPRGGLHLIFSQPNGKPIGCTVGVLGERIDTRGVGGYILLPPSQVDGKAYAWELAHHPDSTPLAPFPEPLARLLTERKAATKRELPAAGQPIKEGERNQRLFAMGCALRRFGAPDDEISHAVVLANRRCQPPLPDDELNRIIESAAAYKPLDVKPPRAADNQGRQAHIRTAAEWLALDIPPPTWAVPGILRQGFTLFASAERMGKTYLILNLALSVASGGKALGQIDVDPGDVLLILMEDDAASLQERLNNLLGDGEQPPTRLHIALDWPRLDRAASILLTDGWKNILPPGWWG